MSRNFTLSCCSTVDVPYHYLESRSIPVLFYTYVVDDVTYVDDMGRDPQALPHFYEMLAAGKLPQTSQVNVAEYMAFFEELLKRGGDVLHLGFTSGQSGSIHNAFLAAEMLKEKYPEQKLLVVDTLCSSSGYGMLVDTVADMRDTGATVEEAYQWTMDNRNKVHHQFFSTDMTQFRRTGRVSGAAATVATVLNIIYVFNSFPIVWTITKGDPASRTDTLVTYLYKLAFYNGKQGEAAAVSVIGFLILLVCASFYMVSTLKKGDE